MSEASGDRRNLVIFGAGGFARELRWLLEAGFDSDGARWTLEGFVVTDSSSSDPLIHNATWLRENITRVAGAALGIGTPAARAQVASVARAEFPQLEWPALVHSSVTMDWESSSLGQGAVICAGTIGTVEVSIGDFTMINLACTIGHGAQIGKSCVLNPTVNVSGDVVIGDEVLIGTGVQILQRVTIGDRAVIGAGAVVTKDVPPDTTVVGVPARPVQS